MLVQMVVKLQISGCNATGVYVTYFNLYGSADQLATTKLRLNETPSNGNLDTPA